MPNPQASTHQMGQSTSQTRKRPQRQEFVTKTGSVTMKLTYIQANKGAAQHGYTASQQQCGFIKSGSHTKSSTTHDYYLPQ
eukprot:5492419-Heterocapsa_arctica.AAC.1